MILFPPTPVIGIDPGQSGAVVRLHNEKLTCCRGFKNLQQLAEGVASTMSGTGTWVIEQVSAMPGQGVCSMFSFGRATGAAFGAIFAGAYVGGVFGIDPKIDVYEVAPQKWQNYFRAELSIPKKDAFDSCVVAQHLLLPHPDMEKSLCHRRGLDHNACDAFLIAVWAANHLGTETLLERRSVHCSTSR